LDTTDESSFFCLIRSGYLSWTGRSKLTGKLNISCDRVLEYIYQLRDARLLNVLSVAGKGICLGSFFGYLYRLTKFWVVEDFRQIIQQHFGELRDHECELIISFFKEEKFQKNDFFTETGKVCDRLSIIRSGILRVYAYADGKDVTQWIATDNSFMTEVLGFFFDQPNRWTIQAFTDTTLWSITKSDYQKLSEVFPKWNEIEKHFIVKCFAMIEDRVFAHLSMSAEERYNAYFEQNKELFNKIPLHYIASVLGMSPETFSRIRKRQMEKP
jgi:CRP-like cAMP-binding protein